MAANVNQETLHSLFLNAASRYPSNIALTYDKGHCQECLTYKELADMATLASLPLKKYCRQDNQIIAIYSRQFPGLIGCLLGILQKPAAFAPVGLDWPPKMLSDFLMRLDAKIVLVDTDLLRNFEAALLYLTKGDQTFNETFDLIRDQSLLSLGFVLVKLTGDTFLSSLVHSPLAYVMQTSGTTGQPKIVKVPHRCIVPNVTSLLSCLAVTSNDAVALISPYTFDPFVVQLFLALSSGGRAVIIPESVKSQPEKLCNMLFERQKTTVFQPTTSLMHYLGTRLIKSKVLGQHSSLKVLAFGGEACPPLSTLQQWKHPTCKTRMFNLYGITEVSCWATCHEISESNLTDSSQIKDRPMNVVDTGEDIQLQTIDFHDAIPLGLPLIDTLIELRDENEMRIDEGIGQVFIGGANRICLLDDEILVCSGTMRATGDWGYIRDNQIWYCGRKDRQIKRQGKRLSLLWIEQVLSKALPDAIFTAAIEPDAVEKLHIFVTSTSGAKSESLISHVKNVLHEHMPGYAHPDQIHVIPKLPMTSHGKVDTRVLLDGIQGKSQEANIEVSPKEFLTQLWGEFIGWSQIVPSKPCMITDVSLKDFVSGHSSDVMVGFTDRDALTGKHQSASFVKDDNMFVTSGGTSIQAVRLADNIESWLRKKHAGTSLQLAELLDVILNKPFVKLCEYVEQKATMQYREDVTSGTRSTKLINPDLTNSNDLIAEKHSGGIGSMSSSSLPDHHMVDSKSKHLRQDIHSARTIVSQDQSQGNPMFSLDPESGDPLESVMTYVDNKTKESSLEDHSSSLEHLHTVGVKRRKVGVEEENSLQQLNHTQSRIPKEEDCISEAPTCCYSVRRGMQRTACGQCENLSAEEHKIIPIPDLQQKSSQSAPQANKIHVFQKWRTDLYKCIDASPLVVGVREEERAVVYIGSHAHVFMAVLLSTGEVLWETRVGDRIESSAVLSRCGQYVVVGCYDGKVYVFSRHSGIVAWTFQTGGPVKSSPCVDSSTGLVWIGSHDHHMYALDLTKQYCACSIDCGSSCFSSPCVNSSPHLIYTATLAGDMFAVNDKKKTVIWSRRCPKPIFSSPMVIPFGVICACVDGVVYSFDHDGNGLWEFKASGPIFSTPSYFRDEQFEDGDGTIVFGSHDGHVYCVSMYGELRWSFASDSQVYCTPFVASLADIRKSSGKITTLPSMAPQHLDQSDVLTPLHLPWVDVNHSIRGGSHPTKGSDYPTNRESAINLSQCEGHVLISADHVPGSVCHVLQTEIPESKASIMVQSKVHTFTATSLSGGHASKSSRQPIVFAFSTRGTLYALSMTTGELVASLSLPGEVFSSPVVVGDTIVVGCRDNFLYSLKVITHSEV